MMIEYDAGTVVKRAATGDDEGRLEREAALLVEARHTGVVVLLDSGRDERGLWLRLEDAGGVTIETILAAGGAEDVLLPLLATVATTVADLHDIGVVHGAIEASHVLVDRDRRPLLCSFGHGGHVSDLDPAGDVIAIAHLIETALAGDLPMTLGGLVDAALDPHAGRHRVSARDLADALRRTHNEARGWPGNSSRVLRPRNVSHRVRSGISRPPGPVLAALAVGAVLIVVAVFVILAGPGPRATRVVAPVRPPTAPPVGAGPPFSYRAGVLTFSGQRFSVGESGDQVAIGRWACGDPQVALLRPDGRIYVFDHLARAGLDQEGRLIASAPGATWLRAQPGARTGCDVIMVGNSRGSALVRTAAA